MDDYILDLPLEEKVADQFRQHYIDCKDCCQIYSAELDIVNAVHKSLRQINKETPFVDERIREPLALKDKEAEDTPKPIFTNKLLEKPISTYTIRITTNIEELHEYAKNAEKEGAHKLAEGYYHQILNIKPDDYVALNNLGALYFKDVTSHKTEKVTKKTPIKSDPSKIEGENSNHHATEDLVNQMQYFYFAKKLKSFTKEDAKETLIKAYNKNPKKYQICNNLAIAHYDAKEKSDAIHYIEEAHKLAPDNATVQKNREILLGKKEGKLEPIYIH
jgi:tetratricopeptide (TPR) repeat protein